MKLIVTGPNDKVGEASYKIECPLAPASFEGGLPAWYRHMKWWMVQGRVVEGYRVASSPSKEYPYGALERQRPIFKARGLDLEGFFNGTLNIDIRPRTFELIRPEFTFREVEWTDLHPPEHFSFSRCGVVYRGIEYEGWVYYPHPETKLRHFQNPSLLEVIAMPIPGIGYGEQVTVKLNPRELIIH